MKDDKNIEKFDNNELNEEISIFEIEYLGIKKNYEYEKIIYKVLKECFKTENISSWQYYINIILTNPENIRKINKKYRNIDKFTDVLSFPMFEKDEIKNTKFVGQEVLGDIIISIEKVKEQAIEYGHSFKRELSYMIVHGFYHLMGEDHIEEEERKQMREKEEKILSSLNIERI